jgi:hypothetical protein
MVKGRELVATEKILDNPQTIENVGYVPSTKGDGKGEYAVFTVKGCPGGFFRCGGAVFVSKIRACDEIREQQGHTWEQAPQVIITKKPSKDKGKQDYFDLAFLTDDPEPAKK